jgi:tetratricopeptide (TPR) repeat protein
VSFSTPQIAPSPAATSAAPIIAPAVGSRPRPPWLQIWLLVVVTCAAYSPVLSNGFVWDDPDYVINNRTLRSTAGLAAMWTDITSLPQWYPITHTTFWVEYHLWGTRPLGYHIDNVLLHVAGALLLWRLLKRLAIPGAWLAAMLFALHPIHVESVAWITERKNTLSTFFYFLAALAYLRTAAGRRLLPDGPGIAGYSPTDPTPAARNVGWATATILLFAAAILSKSVACTLPAALGLFCWWRNGRLGRRDILPLLPMIVIGLAMAWVTSWLEIHQVGATGPRWTFGSSPAGEVVARTLIAGRVLWFYAAKFLAPLNLSFIYPRWHIDTSAAWQFLFPIAAVACVLALWLLRRRFGRGPLCAVLFFIGTLVPALGYFNVYPMQFSFVADHFQHLAGIGLATLAAVGLARLNGRFERFGRVLATLIIAALAILTARQCLVYHDAITLWSDAVAKNPNSWVTQFNLGRAIIDERDDEQRYDAAIPYFQRALQNGPDIPDTHVNVGIGFMRLNRPDDARREFLTALSLKPDFAQPMVQLGKLEVLQNHPAQAESWFKNALAVIPGFPEAHAAYARLLQNQKRFAEALAQWQLAVDNDPEDSDMRYNLATLELQLGQFDAAAANLRIAVQYAPQYVQAWTNLGAALLLAGHRAEAADAFNQALRLRPGFPPAEEGLRRAQSP